jgi:hypothetical protein
MSDRVVLCFRWHDPETESARYLAAAERIWRRIAAVGGESLSWSSDRYCFGFEASAFGVALETAIGLLSEAKTHAVGIALRELVTDGTGRSWGPALVLAETLAAAASPGEILLDPTLPQVQAGLLATLGTIPVRIGGERIGGALLLPGACPSDGFRSSLAPISAASDALVFAGLAKAIELQGESRVGPLGERAPRKPTTHKFEATTASSEPRPTNLSPLPAMESAAPASRQLNSEPKPSVGRRSSSGRRAPGQITAAGAFLEDRERPSILAALRTGDAPSLLEKAAELRKRDADSAVAESLEGLAMIVSGDAAEGVRALRDCALHSERHSGPRRVRARLALAVGYSLAGDRLEAVLAGLGALARARECGDARGEMASAQLLSNLSRSDGQTTVAAAWAAAASP